jgi:hypothetical protein
MIYYVCRGYRSHTIRRFLATVGRELGSFVRLLRYEDLFAAPAIPVGHYIFTDFDRLTPRGIEETAAIASLIAEVVPAANVLNRALQVQERYALLRTLARMGLNPFDVARLDEGRTLRFPVFIRRERGADGPETGLLHNEEEFEAALAQLTAAGRTRKGRIAVEYVDTRAPDGLFRKFSALRVANRVVPIHIHATDGWVVKSRSNTVDEALAAQEYEYVRDNPHRDELMRIFEIARIDFGRIDYALLDGRLVTFEINTNPTLPRARKIDQRQQRRALVVQSLVDAFRAIDAPLPAPKLIFKPKKLDVVESVRLTLQRLKRRKG